MNQISHWQTKWKLYIFWDKYRADAFRFIIVITATSMPFLTILHITQALVVFEKQSLTYNSYKTI